MKLSNTQIRELLAGVYAAACKDELVNMKNLTDALETIRLSIEQQDEYRCWHNLRLKREIHDTMPLSAYLSKLRSDYFFFLADCTAAKIKEVTKTNPAEGFLFWKQEYTKALANLQSEVCNTICRESFGFNSQQQEYITHFNLLHHLILEGNWIETIPFFTEIINDPDASAETRGLINLLIAEIIFYWIPERNDAPAYIEKAKSDIPGHERIKIVWGEYHQTKGEQEKARNYYLETITAEPDNSDNYLNTGESYKDEGKYTVADEWYNDALNINFLNPNIYNKKIGLLFSQGSYTGKQNEVEELLAKIARIEPEHPYRNTYYNTLRDVGYYYYTYNSYEDAANYYRQACNLKPTFNPAYIDLAYIKAYQGKFDESESLLKQVTERDSNYYTAWWALAWLYEKASTTEKDLSAKALDCYNRCISIMPERSADCNNAAGLMFYNLGNYAKAAAYYDRAISLKPATVIYYNNKKQALKAMGDNGPQMEEILKKICELEPGNAENKNKLAIYYYENKLYDKAITYYKEAIKLNNTEPVYYESLGLAYEQLPDDKKAVEAYENAIALEKNSGNYYNRLGLFYYNRKIYSAAVDNYLKALEKEPAKKTYKQNLAYAYEATNDNVKAAEQYNDILKEDKENDDLRIRLVSLQIKTGDLTGARSNLDILLAKEPLNYTNLQYDGYYYETAGRWDEALNIYLKALNQYPDDEYFNNRAGVLKFQTYKPEEIKDCIRYYQKAINANPAAAVYYQNLGLAYENLGNYPQAEEAYLKSLQLEPGNDKYLNYTGVFYNNKLKNYQKALLCYDKAVAINGSEPMYYYNIAYALQLMGNNEKAEEATKKALALQETNSAN